MVFLLRDAACTGLPEGSVLAAERPIAQAENLGSRDRPVNRAGLAHVGMGTVQGLRLWLAGVVAVGVGALVVASPAMAHARLLRTVPADGARVARAPRWVRVFFDGPVQVASGIRAIDAHRRSVVAGQPRIVGDGRVLAIPLVRVAGGREVSVLWRIVSDDGHLESGVVTFAIGRGGLRPLLTADTGVSAVATSLRWLFLSGLLLAVGGVGYALAQAGKRFEFGPRVLALVAVAYAGALAGGAGMATEGLSGTRFDFAYAVGAAVAGVGLLGAISSLRYRSARLLTVGAALVLIPVPAVGGHALDAGQPHVLGVALDALHVMAASVWIGGVASLLLERRTNPGSWACRLRRFSPIALGSVTVLAATGIGRARFELASAPQLWSTWYGRVLLGKSALLLVLVTMGWWNRRRLAAGSFSWRAWKRPLTIELALLGSLVSAVAVLTSLAPGVAVQAALRPNKLATTTGLLRFPRSDRVVAATQAGDLAVVVWEHFDRRLETVQVSVINPGQLGVSGLALETRSGRDMVSLKPCGSGCYVGRIQPTKQLTLAIAQPDHRGPRRLRFLLPPRAAPAANLVARATRVYRALHTLTIHEKLASNRRDTIHATYTVAAPDRLKYTIAHGPQAVIIGSHRWDRSSDQGYWHQSAQSLLREPEPFWGDGPIRDAHLISTQPTRNGLIDIVSFFAPSIPAWFTIRVQRRTLRTVQLEMIAAAHFMQHRYSRFNAPAEIRAPHSGRG